MLNTPYYLLRSKSSGQYLVARPPVEGGHPEQPTDPFLLLFIADFDALSYLNAHAGELAPQFSVEYCDRAQIKTIADRWSYKGIGIVNDPLVPRVEFMSL
ncbi:MAG: hypothetical protein AAFO06_16755 [Cyanobacteria bacterium J06597_16]